MPLPDTERLTLNRRRLLQAAGVGAATVAAPAAGAAYPHVPAGALVAETVSVAAIQRRVASAAVAANVRGMCDDIDRAQEAGRKHLITFSGRALQGAVMGNERDLRAVAIGADGPEVAAIAGKAREHGTFVSFGAWATDRDWPDHVIEMSFLIGPNGTVLARDWAPIGDDVSVPSAGRFAATVESEFEPYMEMYGDRGLLPVHGTSIGAIAQAPVIGAPEIFRAYALKGAEVFLRTASHGYRAWDAQAAAGHNHCFSIMTTAAATEADPAAMFAGHGGRTAIFGPTGDVIAEAGSTWEQTLTASLPMAAYRAEHRRPKLQAALILPAFEQARGIV